MKTKRLLASLFALGLILSASSAMAQGGSKNARNALHAGQSALSFGVPAGGNPYVSAAGTSVGGLGGLFSAGSSAALGYHYMATDRLRVGLNLGLSLQATDTKTTGSDETTSATSFGLDLAPQANFYFGNTVGTVVPFWFAQLRFSTFSDGNDDTSGDIDDTDKAFNPAEQSTLSVQGGLGVEWFPVTRFSISGQVGLNLGLLNPTTGDATMQVENKFGLNLFTSALAASLYF